MPTLLISLLALLLAGSLPSQKAGQKVRHFSPQTNTAPSQRSLGPYLGGILPPRAPGEVDQWQLAPAFGPRFDNVMDIDAVPRSNRLCVAGRDGTVKTFDTTAGTTAADVLLDLSGVVARVHDGGFMGIAFHPEFGLAGSPNRTFIYVFYCGSDTGTYPTTPSAGFFDVYLRLARYEVPDGTWAADPQSELRMLNLRLYNSTHRGGDITFGPDGLLYVPIGDQYRYDTAQTIDDNLEGGILRIDVDQDPSRSHAPLRTMPQANPEELSGVGYWIPDDNPFNDPSGAVFEEFFTIGHRNPHKITFDPAGGTLWSGEVGDSTREEVNILVAGGNYGWPFREGELPGPRPAPQTLLGTLTEPVAVFDRSEATAIIGGRVSRTARLPALEGKYICGDYISGRIWAVTADPTSGVPTHQLLMQVPTAGVSAFGQGPDGEVYVALLFDDQPLFRFEQVGQTTAEPPLRLSELGAFRDFDILTPIAGVVPYAPAHPFWSDHAKKTRWIAVPTVPGVASSQIEIFPRGDWKVPEGTVAIKHFELPMDRSTPAQASKTLRPLETRFMVMGEGRTPYGLTYRWLPDGTDAVLMTDGATDTFSVTTPTGTVQQTWQFPDRNQCITCHNPATGGFLGVGTHQLNCEFVYTKPHAAPVARNQLEHWGILGLLQNPVPVEALADMPRAADRNDPVASLDLRAQSYLDANCASCHRPGTAVPANFDTRLTTPLYGKNLVSAPVNNDLGIAGALAVAPGDPGKSMIVQRLLATGASEMPPLARHVVDTEGAALLEQWIQNLPTDVTPLTLGNQLSKLPRSSTAYHTLVVNKDDIHVNDGSTTQTVRFEAFRFQVAQLGGSITPFAVKVLGTHQYEVVAIGTPRSSEFLHLGPNAVPFADGPTPSISLAPGETLAIGFMDATPHGRDGYPGDMIPFCTCSRADDLWILQGFNLNDSAQIQMGVAPFGGSLLYERREYAFAIDLTFAD